MPNSKTGDSPILTRVFSFLGQDDHPSPARSDDQANRQAIWPLKWFRKRSVLLNKSEAEGQHLAIESSQNSQQADIVEPNLNSRLPSDGIAVSSPMSILRRPAEYPFNIHARSTPAAPTLSIPPLTNNSEERLNSYSDVPPSPTLSVRSSIPYMHDLARLDDNPDERSRILELWDPRKESAVSLPLVQTSSCASSPVHSLLSTGPSSFSSAYLSHGFAVRKNKAEERNVLSSLNSLIPDWRKYGRRRRGSLGSLLSMEYSTEGTESDSNMRLNFGSTFQRKSAGGSLAGNLSELEDVASSDFDFEDIKNGWSNEYRILTQGFHKPLLIYNESSQKLISLCDLYARHGLELDMSSSDRSQGRNSILEAQKWCHMISTSIKIWASLDVVSVLVQWASIKGTLEMLHHIRPDGIRTLQQESFANEFSVHSYTFRPRIEETMDAVRFVLSSKELVQSIMHLEVPDSQSLVDLFDQVSSNFEAHDRLSTTLFHTLRKLCANQSLLPKSFRLSSKNLKMKGKKPVAAGGFADVWRGKYHDQKVALKAFRIHEKGDLRTVYKSFCREAVLWKRLRHPNITPFYGIDTRIFSLCMVCQWMPNGCITAFLIDNPHEFRLALLVDTARGLEYLHSRGVVHGDLKGANILINADRRACLTDFGLTAVTYDPDTVNAMSTTSTVNGSTRWMAPEILYPEQAGLEKARSSLESDIYSLAMVVWEVFAGSVPFSEHARDATVIFKICSGARPERPLHATDLGLSDYVWRLVEICWSQEWQSRPPVSVVLQCLDRACDAFVDGHDVDETNDRKCTCA
ncbi:hypothetical protein AcW1_001757 [Taiwanofungus camphoratus]|nr:hypothetical protein AcV5_000192 [Antrodia cinnamomea]KAI0944946.1 hypothetical protein AcV7_001610 [Antrodia cinnamomea]KAI0945565.1 hypothetical protein AcW1_001757 [Antrodia cinnamomea]